MALVLCTGTEASLMKTRQFILEQAGHTVFSVSSSQELETICSKHNFEVAVIGQNTPAPLKQEHMALIRRLCPAIKVLELYPPYVGKILDHADAWLEMPPERPELFVRYVDRLAASNTASPT